MLPLGRQINMELRELNETELEQVLTVHMQRDFPADELRPKWTFEKMLDDGACRFYGLFDGDALMAYGDIVYGNNSDLLDFFAVMPELRGSGIGTAALRELTGISKEMILEVESPYCVESAAEANLRRRRIDFYNRLGAIDTEISGKALGVEFLVLYIGKRRQFDTLGDELRDIYRVIYPGIDVEKEVTYGR